MSEKTVTFRWRPIARKFLGKRDSRTRLAIQREFEQNHRKADAIQYDTATNSWVTPVADDRYSVIWRVLPESTEVEIQAVVPARFDAGSADRVRAQVAEILLQESADKAA